MTYFHGAFKHLFLDGGMKDALMKLKQSHEGYRVWVRLPQVAPQLDYCGVSDQRPLVGRLTRLDDGAICGQQWTISGGQGEAGDVR